jgi:hypothetical protein
MDNLKGVDNPIQHALLRNLSQDVNQCTEN